MLREFEEKIKMARELLKESGKNAPKDKKAMLETQLKGMTK
jgi:hypothetical protein